jgi:transposase
VTTSASTPHKLSDDLAAVRRKLEQLGAEGLIAIVIDLLVRMRDTNNALASRLANALRQLYGAKSQKVSTDDLKKLLGELGKDAPLSADAAAAPESAAPPEGGQIPLPPEPPKPPRGRGGRAPLPKSKDLPRRPHRVPVAEAERKCPICGAERKCMGTCKSEVLEFKSAHFEIIEEEREKLVCPACPEAGVTTAPSEKVMDRGRPGPNLLPNILVKKFQDAMPPQACRGDRPRSSRPDARCPRRPLPASGAVRNDRPLSAGRTADPARAIPVLHGD